MPAPARATVAAAGGARAPDDRGAVELFEWREDERPSPEDEAEEVVNEEEMGARALARDEAVGARRRLVDADTDVMGVRRADSEEATAGRVPRMELERREVEAAAIVEWWDDAEE